MYPDPNFNPEYNPIGHTNFVQPVDTNQFDSAWINHLYSDSQLTQDEYLILDFLAVNSLERSGSVIFSFQGLKRLTELHQARVTKALNRLAKKDLVVKLKSGYKLTLEGMQVFNKFNSQIPKRLSSERSNLAYTVGTGIIQGPLLSSYQIKEISEGLVGKWFGKYRFISKVDLDDGFEVCWLSTNGSITTTLKIQSDNQLIVSVSAPLQNMAQEEVHLISDHLSGILEQIVDAPVIFNSFKVFEKSKSFTNELDDAKYTFAG